jgi:tetratricopeptide (TPR) repeat protein
MLALVVLAVGPLLPTLRATFVYDDTSIIRDNPFLRGWGALAHVWSQPYWPGEGVDALGLYRPLHVALLATVWNAGGGSARWMHVYALLLAGVTTLAVWWLLRRATGFAAALISAAWFATQTLHVESVASVANSSELLVVFCVVALIAVLCRTEPTPAQPARDWGRAALVGILAAAALMAKESGLLAVPLAALTLWGWRRGNPVTLPLLRANMRAWLAAGVAVTAVLLTRLVVLGAPVSHGSIAAQGIGTLSGPERAAAMLSLWPRIAGMLTWPSALSPYYGPTIFPAPRLGFALLSALIVAALVALCVVAARRGDRRPLVAVGWIALTYFPASNLLAATGQILSDRTLFGATVGMAMGIAWMIDRLPAFGRRVAMVLVALLIARAAVVGFAYSVAWTSHRTLWARLAEVSPNEHLSYKLRGMDARARGDIPSALVLLTRALEMAPTDRQIRFELGQAQYASQRFAAAVKTLEPLMSDADARGEPEFVALYLDASGRAAGAEAVVRAAVPLLRSESSRVAALFAGTAYEQLGNRAAADSAYTMGLRRAPGDSALTARLAALRRR